MSFILFFWCVLAVILAVFLILVIRSHKDLKDARERLERAESMAFNIGKPMLLPGGNKSLDLFMEAVIAAAEYYKRPEVKGRGFCLASLELVPGMEWWHFYPGNPRPYRAHHWLITFDVVNGHLAFNARNELCGITLQCGGVTKEYVLHLGSWMQVNPLAKK